MKKIVLTLLFPIVMLSQGKEGFQTLLSVDNDFLGVNNKDENYTGGAKLEVQFPALKFWQPFYKFKNENCIQINRIGFGGTAYTPQDLVSIDVVSGDRPYASLLFLNFGLNSYDLINSQSIQSELIIGNMGSSAPGNAQAYIHENKWFGSERPVPLGWDNQIGYNGSFILNYNLRYLKSLKFFSTNSNSNDFNWVQTNLVGKFDLGNYMINLQGGFKLNLINLNSTILNDYYPNIIGFVPVESTYKKVRFNVFIEPNVRIVGYNATLEGLLFNDKSIYKIEHSDIRRVLFELNTGFNLQLFDMFYFRYSFFGRSQEFEGGKPFHSWGGITLGFSTSRWNN
jgi:hypothetical protein